MKPMRAIEPSRASGAPRMVLITIVMRIDKKGYAYAGFADITRRSAESRRTILYALTTLHPRAPPSIRRGR